MSDTLIEAPQAREPVEWSPQRHIPRGSRIVLRKRGTTFVRTMKGPSGAPVVVLLHGWAATAALNWHQVFEPLSQHFRVIAPDLRGHGRGIRSQRCFTLADCADDVAATLDALDAAPAIAVGYSMGGPVAQLLWKRRPDAVSGLVLCATGAELFTDHRERRLVAAMSQILAGTTRAGAIVGGWIPGSIARRMLNVSLRRWQPQLASWARRELSKHSLRMLLEAGRAIANHSSQHWLHEVDVPTTVLVTLRDSAVPPELQLQMARAIPHCHVRLLEDGHDAFMAPEFGLTVVEACLDVQRRVELKAQGRWPHLSGAA